MIVNRPTCTRSLLLFFLPVFLLASDPATAPVSVPAQPYGPHIRWKPLLWESLFFLGVEHGYRLGTENFTRDRLHGKFFPDFGRSAGNLHGWGDGDPFIINYIGHPMEGSVTGLIFVQNDMKYQKTEFGRNRDYWKSRLRATAFAFFSSAQFEVGPLSEASLGNTQAYYPQQGLVDHVVTPAIGLVWMIGEDAIDQYLVKRIEAHSQNRWVKMFARSALNPSRSMANAMRMEVPWHRDTRPGVFGGESTTLAAGSGAVPPLGSRFVDSPPASLVAEPASAVLPVAERPPLSDLNPSLVPTFELSTSYSYTQLSLGKAGSLSCHGGGATANYNVNSWLGIIADVWGCKMLAPGHNISGDSTTYVLGPRFTWRKSARWQPYLQFLAGGDKLTIETTYPERKPPDTDKLGQGALATAHSRYNSQDATNSFAIQFGGGIDYAVNRAVAIHVADVQDLHTWAKSLNGRVYPNNLRISTGLVFRFGTW